MNKLIIGTEIDTKKFDAQIEEVKKKLEDLRKLADSKILAPEEGTREWYELNSEIERTENKLVDLQKQKEKANATPIEDTKTLGEIDFSLTKIIKKVGKWALAIFSVRSAYLFVRSAVSTISQYDKQLGANIQYIRYALAMAIKPIIEWIVNAVYTLLQYINFIAKKWFDIDIFAGASAKNFNKANSSAKKLQRTLAGFDEMNVLSSNKDESGNVGASYDLSKIKDVEMPGWIKWIAENKDTILKVVGAIAGLFVVSKITKLFTPLQTLGSLLGMSGILGSLTGIAALATITITIAYLVQDISEVKEEIGKTYDKANKKLTEHISEQKDVKQILKDENVLLDTQKIALRDTSTIFGTITGISKQELEQARKQVDWTQKRLVRIKDIRDQEGLTTEENLLTLATSKDIVQTNKDLMKYLDPNSALYGRIERTTRETEEFMADIVEDLIKQGVSYDEIAETVGLTKEDIKEIANGNWKAGIKVETEMPSKDQTKSKIASWWDGIKKSLAKLILGFDVEIKHTSIQGSFSPYSAGGGKHALGGIIPYASGGIINRPGSGVPIGGEHGMEGVIPMTHEGQMQLLGETIAKYINVNVVNNTNLDGRLIARQINKVQNNSNFAANR